MTFETLTVIELLLSASNYPEDKCDKIRDELSTMDKKAKAWDKHLETVRQEAIDEFGADDPRVDFSEKLTKEIYMEDK